MAPSCAYCGIDSIGTCGSCNERACNRHLVVSVEPCTRRPAAVALVHPVGQSIAAMAVGPYREAFTQGPPRCLACRQRDGQRAGTAWADAEDQAIQRAAVAAARLTASTDPAELVKMIREHGSALSPEHCRSAWLLIARSGIVAPTHEEITAEVTLDRRRAAPAGPWSIVSQRNLWTFDQGLTWLDADGGGLAVAGRAGRNQGRAIVSWSTTRRRPSRSLRATAVLPRGTRFELSPDRIDGQRYVAKGFAFTRWEAVHAGVTAASYRDAIVEVVRKGVAPP
jgi:hypothetical protein